MQTPEVIARMRAEAAALGLAQDVIEENWPKEPTWRREARAMNAELWAEEGEQEVDEPSRRPSPQESYNRRLLWGVAPPTPQNANKYFRALEKGEVDAAGGRVAWLAKLRAKSMFGREERRIHDENRAELAERRAEKAAEKAEKAAAYLERMALGRSKRVPKTTGAGAWDEVVDATKTKPDSQTRL